MATDYFDFLEQNSSDNPASSTPGSNNEGMVNLTTRADAECQVVCDGDFLFLLNANQIAKEKAPVGQHILQFISIEHPEVTIEKIVDFPDAGKNYLVIVNEFQARFSATANPAAGEKIVDKKDSTTIENQAMIKEDYVSKYLDINYDPKTGISKDAVEDDIKPAMALGNASAKLVYSRLLCEGVGMNANPVEAMAMLGEISDYPGVYMLVAAAFYYSRPLDYKEIEKYNRAKYDWDIWDNGWDCNGDGLGDKIASFISRGNPKALYIKGNYYKEEGESCEKEAEANIKYKEDYLNEAREYYKEAVHSFKIAAEKGYRPALLALNELDCHLKVCGL